MPETPTTTKCPQRPPRLYGWILFTLLLLLVAWWLAPHRIPLTGWKMVLVTGGAALGYWLDRALFPYARPGDLYDMAAVCHSPALSQPRPFAALPAQLTDQAAPAAAWLQAASLAGLRRAIIVFGCIIGLTLGL